MAPSGTAARSLSSRLVEVDEPTVVDVVEVPELVEVVSCTLVEVVETIDVGVEDEEDDPSSSLVDVVLRTVVGVDTSGVVAPVDAVESSSSMPGTGVELVDRSVPDMTSPAAQAAPTTAIAATTEVNMPSAFLII